MLNRAPASSEGWLFSSTSSVSIILKKIPAVQSIEVVSKVAEGLAQASELERVDLDGAGVDSEIIEARMEEWRGEQACWLLDDRSWISCSSHAELFVFV